MILDCLGGRREDQRNGISGWVPATVAGFEDGRRWLGARKCKWPLEAGKAKKQIVP